MSEMVGETIKDLKSTVAKFGRANKNQQEVNEFKKWLKEELNVNIRSDLIGLVKELQEGLPPKLTISQRKLLTFSCHGSRYILTRHGVKNVKHRYDLKPAEFLVDLFMHPDTNKYPYEHDPSLNGAKNLWEQMNVIRNNGYKLKGKYLGNQSR